jgi:hypothetical protein
MLGRRDFDEAIANGERNREAIQLVLNWCGNAKVECDARGMLAVHTGLPIGHHHIQCDFADDGGTSHFYEVSEAALDFHDRNCVGCGHRKPMRLPNISKFLAERERRRELRAAEAARADAANAAALATRDETRRRLKERLSPIGQTLVDDIALFDLDASEENRQRLMASARMAPEHFTADLQTYILDVCETERWLDGPALEILETLGTDPVRLAALAVRALAAGTHRELAARVLLPLVEHLSPDDAQASVHGAIDLAEPDRRDFLARGRTPDPALLRRLYETHQDAVDQAIGLLLSSGETWSAESAGRGVGALLPDHPAAAERHARSLIATYVRARLLVRDFDELHGDLYAVRNAVVAAFKVRPAAVDALLQDYVGATGSDFTKRVHDVYARSLQTGYNDSLSPDAERAKIAFRRLLWATTGPFDSGIMEEAVEAFRGRTRDLVPLAAAETDAVFGATLLLAERYRELEKAPLDATHSMARIERNNHLSSYRSLMKALTRLAAEAALADMALLPKLDGFLTAIPEGHELLRSIAIETFSAIADDAAGLATYLPHLYRAMVGPSSLERAGAAAAIGKLGSTALGNLPTLVFEAFVPLLHDNFVIVHKYAARALRSSLLPDQLRMRALRALLDLIRHYRTQTGEDNFVMECVRTLAGSADAFGKDSGVIRRWLIGVCMDVEPIYLESEIRSIVHTLGTEADFAKLVIRLLPHMVDRYNNIDRAQELVMGLSPSAIATHSAGFEAVGLELAKTDQWITLVVIDALARSGATAAAARVARARIDALGDNPRNRIARLFGEKVELAFALEAAVGANGDGGIAEVSTRWNEIEEELKARRDEQRERDSRAARPFPD